MPVALTGTGNHWANNTLAISNGTNTAKGAALLEQHIILLRKNHERHRGKGFHCFWPYNLYLGVKVAETLDSSCQPVRFKATFSKPKS
jgi:hypothetical protein